MTAGGAAVGARVEVEADAGGEAAAPTGPYITAADREGRYAIELPHAGAWRIEASDRGRTATVTITIPDETQEIERDIDIPRD
jgi:hypothetical protein